MDKVYIVYTLRASDEEAPFYVGKTFEGSNRFMEHMGYALKKGSKTRTYGKIRSVLERDKEVLMDIVFRSVLEMDSIDREQALIGKLGRLCDGTGILTNHTAGGEGVSGLKMSEDSKKKMSESKLRMYEAGAVANCSKSVTVFDNDGNILGVYESTKRCDKALGLKPGRSGSFLHARAPRCIAGKYRVKEGIHSESIDPLPPPRRNGRAVAIAVFTEDGEHLKTYPTFVDAEIALGLVKGRIAKVMIQPHLPVVGKDGTKYKLKRVEE